MNINDFKVSIIVSVYNIEDFVSGCIESIIRQTYKNLEINLVDDGSTDKSAEICDKYSALDKRIKVIHKKNGGLSSARNAGLDICTGDFVMFVDGDDYLVENAVEILTDIQKKYNSDIVQFDYEETDTPYVSKCDTEMPEPLYVNDKKEMFDTLYKLGGCAVSACTKLYKKELFEGLRFKDGIFFEDEQLIPYVLMKAESVTYITNKLYCYYMRTGSIIKSTFNEKKLVVFDILNERIKILSSLGYWDLVEKEKSRIFSNLVYYWTNAKECKNKVSCDKIKNIMRDFLKNNNPDVSGYMIIIKFLCRINVNFISTYYWASRKRIIRTRL